MSADKKLPQTKKKVTKTNPKGQKLKRIEGKHIKHSANSNIRSAVQKETTFLVKSSTPFISALKRIHKMLDKFNKAITSNKNKYQGGEYKKLNYITVKSMGKSIENTLGIANKLQNEYHYRVDILTGTVEVLDEFSHSEDASSSSIGDPTTTFQKRKVSTIELRVWLKRE